MQSNQAGVAIAGVFMVSSNSEILISSHVFRTDINTKKLSIPGC
jgi:hypothetical protein